MTPRRRVLRISHSGVVGAWRERERLLRGNGTDVTLVSARRWDEGGTVVALDPGGDDFVLPAGTVGTHPNVFLFDPRVLWRALRSGQWDIVDVHEEPCSLAGAEVLTLMGLARVRSRLVLYSAQNIEKRYPPPFRWFERVALRRAAAVSVCNRESAAILGRKGFRGDPVVIPLGVDVQAFSPAPRRAPEDPLRLGYVGRLTGYKGVAVLVDALAALPDAHLDLVGGGPEENALRLQVGRLGLGGRVRFLGAVDQGALAELYRSFDVVVVPSIPTARWTEQFGRVAVEAMASGVPLVVSRSGALPEVVGDAGVLVTPGDPVALAAAIGNVLGDPDTWTRLREAGLERVRGFTWEAVAARYEDLYERVAP